MKKKLEAELMSLAHKILKLKNKSELRVLRDEAKILHEKLAVLLFVEEYLSEVKPTISLTEAEKIILDAFGKEAVVTPSEPGIETAQTLPTIEIEETMVDILEEEATPEVTINEEIVVHPEIVIEEAVAVQEESIPQIEAFEEIKEETITLNFGIEEEPEPQPEPIAEIEIPEIPEPKIKNKSKQVSLEDILEDIQPIATFVKASEQPKKPVVEKKEETTVKPSVKKAAEPHHKSVSINDKLRKTVTIGLNDKIAFVKHLFGGSDADFIRVISQLNTFDNYQEAYNFIQEIVKPDYNNWAGKEEVEERFMHIVENKFS
jgi:hypothetical protein